MTSWFSTRRKRAKMRALQPAMLNKTTTRANTAAAVAIPAITCHCVLLTALRVYLRMDDLEFLRQLPYRQTLYMAVAWLSLTRSGDNFRAVTVVGKAVPNILRSCFRE
jgi:hypothetical protein